MATNASKKAAQLVLDVTKRLYESGMNSTLSGNVSARIEESNDLMLITPSYLDKVRITAQQLSTVRISDEKLVSGPKQSSEYQVHTHIYRALPNVNAIVHPHPPYSLSIVSARGRKVIEELSINEEEYGYYIGKMGVVRGKAGSKELADLVAAQAKKGANAIIMEDHGTVGIGKTMQEALSRVEALEHMAMKYYITKTLGTER